MNRQTLGISDIGHMAVQLEAVNEFLTRGPATLDLKAHDRAGSERQILLGLFMVRAVGQSGKSHGMHTGMTLQKLGDLLGVCDVAFHAQAQRLNPEQGRKTVKRRLAAAHVAQDLHPRFEYHGRCPEVGVYQAVIRRVRFGKVRKASAGPVKIAAIHNHAADGCAAAAQKLGRAVGDNMRAPFKRPTQIRRGKRVVDHHRDMMRLGNGRHFLKGENRNIRVAQGLAIDNFGIGLDGLFKFFRLGRVYKGRANAHAREGMRELIKRAAIQPAAGHNMVTLATQRHDGHHLRGVAAAGRQPPHPALKGGDPLLQHIIGRVHDARVDIAGFAQREQIGRVLGILKLITRSVVNRNGSAARRWVGDLSCVQLTRIKAVFAFVGIVCAHTILLFLSWLPHS